MTCLQRHERARRRSTDWRLLIPAGVDLAEDGGEPDLEFGTCRVCLSTIARERPRSGS